MNDTKLKGRISSYALISPIDSGGMSHVWKGLDLKSNQTVAIKVFKTEHFNKEALFKNIAKEGLILSLMNHETVVKAIDVIINDTYQALVLEYLDGISLKKYQATPSYIFSSKEQRLWIALKVIEAIDYLANFKFQDSQGNSYEGIFHRDLKPENIILSKDGELKLIDFGLSSLVNSTKIIPRMIDGYSKNYADPDLIDYEKYSIQNEYYSLGIVLTQILELHNQHLAYSKAELLKLEAYLAKLHHKRNINVLAEFKAIVHTLNLADNANLDFSHAEPDISENVSNDYTVLDTNLLMNIDHYLEKNIEKRKLFLHSYTLKEFCFLNFKAIDLLQTLEAYIEEEKEIMSSLDMMLSEEHFIYIGSLYSNHLKVTAKTRKRFIGNDFEVSVNIIYSLYVISLLDPKFKIELSKIKSLIGALGLKLNEQSLYGLLMNYSLRFLVLVDSIGVVKNLTPFQIAQKLRLNNVFNEELFNKKLKNG